MKLKLRVNGYARDLRVVRRGDQLRIAFDDGDEITLRLLSSGDGRFELESGHARIHGAGAVLGRRRQVWVNGRTISYECESPSDVVREPERDTGLAATIPSVVVDVLVAPGDRVEAGQRLVLLESMKMVVPIQAPHEGTIRAVHCTAGQSVDAGVQLLEMAPDTEAA